MARTGASGHSVRHSVRHSSGQDSGSGGSRTVTTRRSLSSSASAIRSARSGLRRAATTAWLTSRTVPAVASAAASRWTRATSVTSGRRVEASATVPTRRAGRPSPPGSRRPLSRSHLGEPVGWSTRNSSSRSPMDMWSASVTDMSEGRSSGTVRPSSVSTLPSNSPGARPNRRRMSSPISTRPVSMAREKAPGRRSSPSTATAGAGQATASAISSRHARSSVSKPSGRSVRARRQPPPSPRTGRAAREKPQSAPATVLSAVTRILLVRGSIAHEVPGMVASDFRVRAPVRSSPMLLSTSRTSAPTFFACTMTWLSSPGTTLPTSCCSSAS